MALKTRFTELCGIEHPIVQGGMMWVGRAELAAAVSNAGGLGILTALTQPTPDDLRREIHRCRTMTDKPFGVNLITMHPRLEQLVDACLEAKVGHIVFAGGIPPGAAMKRAKEGGAKVVCFAPALALAKKLVRSGADALVIEGSEAGGHIGPVSLNVLAQEILPHITEVPVFVAGGIGRGEAILSYLEMGAAGAQIGTRFVCAAESIAHPNFKRAFIRGAARDALPTVQLDERFPVIPVRALQNEGTKRFMEHQAAVLARFQSGELSKEAAQLDIEHFWAGALRRAVVDGDVEQGSLMAGQSVGMVTKEQPAAEIIAELVGQAATALAARRTLR